MIEFINPPREKKRKGALVSAHTLFSNYKLEDKGGYITQEFQDYGYRLAVELQDMPHKSLYIKMAKKEKRSLLEEALTFVSDSKARSKGRLFMWKVKELKAAQPKVPTSKTTSTKVTSPVAAQPSLLPET